jgi:hypothetical protein
MLGSDVHIEGILAAGSWYPASAFCLLVFAHTLLARYWPLKNQRYTLVGIGGASARHLNAPCKTANGVLADLEANIKSLESAWIAYHRTCPAWLYK